MIQPFHKSGVSLKGENRTEVKSCSHDSLLDHSEGPHSRWCCCQGNTHGQNPRIRHYNANWKAYVHSDRNVKKKKKSYCLWKRASNHEIVGMGNKWFLKQFLKKFCFLCYTDFWHQFSRISPPTRTKRRSEQWTYHWQLEWQWGFLTRLTALGPARSCNPPRLRQSHLWWPTHSHEPSSGQISQWLVTHLLTCGEGHDQ